MRIVGTALEWHKNKPEAYITNDKLQEGVCIRILEYSKKGIDSTYESKTPDGEPWIYFGNKCPYVVKSKVNYVVHAIYGANGGITALSTNLAEDPNWIEVECYKGDNK